MDRNQAIGLVLISVLLIVYFQFFTEPAPPPAEPQTEETTTPQETPQTISADTSETQSSPEKDSSSVAQNLVDEFGIFAAGAQGESETQILENDDIKITIDSKGAQVKEVLLKQYFTHDKQPLVLLDEGSSKIALNVNVGGRNTDLHSLYYTSSNRQLNDTTIVEYNLSLGSGQSVKHTYKLPPSGFQLLHEIKLNGIAASQSTYSWLNDIRPQEKDIVESRLKATIGYYTGSGDFDDLTERSNDEEEQINSALKWVAFKQQFFTSAVIPQNSFANGFVKMFAEEGNTSIVKTMTATLPLSPQDISSGSANFKYYFGPNHYQTMKKVSPDFEKNIYLGWPPVNIVNKWLIIPLFNFLENYIANYGVIIIILVLVIKLMLSPLSYKSYVSMAKTKVLKPELDALKEKHDGDMQKVQQAQMKLYQQVGVNPLSGCIPLVLQMPILFAMFYFFPNSIELRQEGFLWASDLSTYDSVLDLPFTIPIYGDHVSLFTLLMTLSTILYQWSNNQVSTVQGPMKSMMYMMPVIFMFVLNSFPAGLSFYYFVANIITFGQQALIRKFVDEDKIKKILEENRLKNKGKKKSKFQMKLEEAMKAGEEAKKNKAK